MMDTTYFSISCSEDGIYVLQGTKGEVSEFVREHVESGYEASPTLPDSDPEYWGKKFVIIRGKIIVPRPVETVITYELD